MSSNIEITPIGSPEPMPDRDRRWAEAAAELEFGALARIRGMGEKWAASLTGVLGAVGLAAFIQGHKTFDGLADDPKETAQVLFVVAVVAVLIATALAIWVSQITGKRLVVESGDELRKQSEKAVDKGLKLIRGSQILALVAALCVLVAGGFLWFGERKAGSGPTVIDIPASITLCEGASTTTKVSEDTSIAVRCVE